MNSHVLLLDDNAQTRQTESVIAAERAVWAVETVEEHSTIQTDSHKQQITKLDLQRKALRDCGNAKSIDDCRLQAGIQRSIIEVITLNDETNNNETSTNQAITYTCENCSKSFQTSASIWSHNVEHYRQPRKASKLNTNADDGCDHF
ncbi:hypothetical protein DAPPUDRAFT_108125 [Daphnia pulex]|uniref:C2H2-type domain-containing protein n=1 Tax=Daphnia pulex TaxID=6669 RepID=E9GZ84_DAPPU|nr:hypothetical protein DAPPUDRAFT_108125 [Daphnia pulex]|eukprot:EFX75201.1 hypothetical protein DAPPUDRAFT_108125 [Daphnia pulex]